MQIRKDVGIPIRMRQLNLRILCSVKSVTQIWMIQMVALPWLRKNAMIIGEKLPKNVMEMTGK